MKISICIPVYNRAAELDELLLSIYTEKRNHRVEVCISDNASTDEILDVVTRWKSNDLDIVFAQNPTNLGADLNYLAAVDLASGDYVWLFGSDDQLTPGALSAVFEFMNYFPSRGIYLFSRTEYSATFDQYLGIRHWLDMAGVEPITADFKNQGQRREFFKRVAYLGGIFSYLSSIIIHRGAWHSVEFDDRFIGTAYSHVFKILKILTESSFPMISVSQYSPVKTRLGADSFRQSAGQRLMLDIDGYKLLGEACFSSRERKYLYFAFRRSYYIEYLSAVANEVPGYFSLKDWNAIWCVCGVKGAIVTILPFLKCLMLRFIPYRKKTIVSGN